MKTKLDLFDIDERLAISAIEDGNCEEWKCPTEILDLADEIEARIDEHDCTGGVVGGCWKPTIKRLTTPAGEPPADWFKMQINLSVDNIELDLRESFASAAERLHEQADQLLDIAFALKQFDPIKTESEVIG